MTTEIPEVHGDPNATEPLALRLDTGLGAGAGSRCGCRACLRERKDGIKNYYKGEPYFVPAEKYTMVLCATCGNKRCPHATDHRHACTASNEAGQPGSWYGGLEAPNAEATGRRTA